MSESVASHRRFLLYGALAVATLDALDAIIFFGVRNSVAPGRIFKGIAAGVLGPTAQQGGAETVLLGVLLHLLIASGIVTVLFLAATRAPELVQQPVLAGPVYGLIVYAVMNFIVIPLSATRSGAKPTPVLVNGLLIHMLGVGTPAVLAVRAALKARRK